MSTTVEHAVTSLQDTRAAAAVADELTWLVQRCAAGDEGALRRMYELQAPRLKGLARRITGSAALAEDVLHDVFVQVFQEAHRFDPARGSASAWLTTLTRFRALDLARGNGRERVMAVLPDPADPGPDPLTLSIVSAEGRRLRACLDRLPGPARHAITLAFIEGRTHVEIAEASRQKLGTLKSLIRRSLRDLRRCLE